MPRKDDGKASKDDFSTERQKSGESKNERKGCGHRQSLKWIKQNKSVALIYPLLPFQDTDITSQPFLLYSYKRKKTKQGCVKITNKIELWTLVHK